MVNEEEKKLVLARLENMPSNMKLSMGGTMPLSKTEMLEHVKKGDEIGKKIVKIQLNYLRSIAKQYS